MSGCYDDPMQNDAWFMLAFCVLKGCTVDDAISYWRTGKPPKPAPHITKADNPKKITAAQVELHNG